MKNKIKLLLILSFIIFQCDLFSQKDKKEEWDVNNPPGISENVDFEVSEGTWMNLDVSPDGKEIVFDLLGDIYKMSIKGGVANLLRGGMAYEVQPRFSPNGKKISFTSDAGGADNIWIMDADGKNPNQVTKEKFRLLNNAVWTSDGDYLIARKHFTSTRSLGAGELWMYHTSGGGGIQLIKKKNDQQDLGEPCVSKDGKYIYYSEDMYPGGYFQYNKDPNKLIYSIKRFDLEKGESETMVSGPGGACRPQISNNGNKIAFVRRVREKSVLYIQDLLTGEQWPVFDGLSKDQQEAWAIFGVYSNFSWTDNDKSIVIWGKGKIWKINVAEGSAEEIKFSALCSHKVAQTVKFKQEVAPEKISLKAVRNAVTSPNGKYLVFNAAGYLYVKALPDGTPKRLTDGTDFEFEPVFNPRGNQLVYVTWNDENKGSLMSVSFPSSGKPKKLNQEKGIFRSPAISPDGKSILFQKEEGNNHQGHDFCVQPGLYSMNLSGGKMERICDGGQFPMFSNDGKEVYFQKGGYLFGNLDKGFYAYNLETQKERTVFKSKYANRFIPSPDGNWIAFNELHNVYIAPFPKTGLEQSISADSKSIPIKKVSRDAGISLHWSSDSKKLNWTLGEKYFSVGLEDCFSFVEGAQDSLPEMDTLGTSIGLELPADIPQGAILLKDARIITMNGDEIIEKGSILIKENRIAQIGPSNEVKIPSKVKIVDCSGKTIMPGIVDVHAHLGTFRYGLSPQKQWSYYANLAFGVTTTHDPSSNSEMVFSQSEMVKTGIMTGPRIFSTGTILYGADGDFKAVINSLEDAKSALRRTQAFGAFSVKSYNQPRREQRQQVLEAARHLKMNVYPEGGSFFFHNMSMIIDGHTGVEHNLPVAPLYNDVVKLWSKTGTGYTPTLIVNYGGLNGEFFFYQNTEVWKNERLLTFTPRSVLDSRSRHRMMVPQEEYENGHILVSKSCKKLSDEGVKVNLGAHGQLQGLGAHWELWMLAQGGISNHQALKSATINGASYLGMDTEIGSLEVGKLADLIVLDKNPLENIRNSETVKYTMVNGRIYESATMNEIGNYNKKRGKFFWELPGNNNNFPWHEDTGSFSHPNCSCRH